MYNITTIIGVGVSLTVIPCILLILRTVRIRWVRGRLINYELICREAVRRKCYLIRRSVQGYTRIEYFFSTAVIYVHDSNVASFFGAEII